MLERFALAALVAIAMSIELAQARNMRSDVPPCTMGNPVAATCDCGTADNGRPVLCHAGQWCHPNRACTNQWFADPPRTSLLQRKNLFTPAPKKSVGTPSP
jgi:hypothetical protein